MLLNKFLYHYLKLQLINWALLFLFSNFTTSETHVVFSNTNIQRLYKNHKLNLNLFKFINFNTFYMS
jgi:hypothetical protein